MADKRGFVGNSSALPFLVEVNAGFGEVHGTAWFEEAELVVEFETRDSISGLFRKEGDFRSRFSDLVEAKFHAGMLTNKIVIEASTIDVIKSIKWRFGHRFHLGIRRKDCGSALSFVDDLNWLIENQDPPPTEHEME